MVADPASFTLTGNAAILTPTMAASAGAFTLTGNAAVLTPTMLAGAGSYVLTGNAAALATASPMLAGTGSFALTGNDAIFTTIPFSVGSGITGGQFSRGRWRDMREAIRAKAEAEHRAKARKKRREREAALQAAAEAKAATEAARALEDQVNAQHAIERMLADAQQTMLNTQRMHEAMRPSPAMLMAAQQAHAQMQAAKDDDEAFNLFMASEG